MFNVTICWDNKKQTKVLSRYLAKFSIDKDFEYDLTTYTSLEKLLNKRPKHIDILFLYIELTDKNIAVDTYKKLKYIYKDIKIIFIPEMINFMLNGLELKDYPYMLEPLKYDCFEEEMASCFNNLNVAMDEIYVNLLNGISSTSLFFIEASGNDCIAYTHTSTFKIPYNINHVENILTSNLLFRCHNNYIVNLKKLSKIGKHFVFTNSMEIPVDPSKFEELKHRLLVMLNLL